MRTSVRLRVHVSRKAVSSILSLVSSETCLVKHWDLLCPFLLQRWQVASFAGHLSRACEHPPQREHVFVATAPGAALGVALALPSLHAVDV